MKNMLAVVIAIGAAMATLSLSLSGETRTQTSSARKNVQAVVIELFTSEGCSTCPPADSLLQNLHSSQPVDGANIIALEEHVDYWNQEGWTDPYSSSEWTLRQQEYVARFKDKEPYTPQMIVDGQTQFLGDEAQAKQLIQQAATQPKTEIVLAAENFSADGAQLKLHVGKLTGNTEQDSAEVWVAVVECELQSNVGAGENAGKTLRHAPVLRSLRKMGVASLKGDSAFETSTRVKFKTDWKTKNLRVVAFVQEKKSMRILGAASIGVSN
jgi:hypothetical protein